MKNKYMTIKEVSEALGVSKLTLRNWDKAGKLIASRYPLNNYRVYLREEIDKIIQKIDSGEKPIKYSKRVKNVEPEKPVSYKLKVIHIKD